MASPNIKFLIENRKDLCSADTRAADLDNLKKRVLDKRPKKPPTRTSFENERPRRRDDEP